MEKGLPSQQKMSPIGQGGDEEIDLKQIVEQYAFYWKWFILSVVIAVITAFIYLRYTTPKYQVDAKILLENEAKASGELAGLAELACITGGGGASAFVVDQIDVLKSRRLMRNVVLQENLYIQYFISGKIKKAELMAQNSPIRLVVADPSAITEAVEWQVEVEDGSLILTNKATRSEIKAEFGKAISIEGLRKVIFMSANAGNGSWNNVSIAVHSIEAVVDNLLQAVQVTPNKEKQSLIVNFSITGPLREKSELILNTLIDVYNNDVTEDKSKVTRATSDFINSRLQLIGEDLADADKKVQDFKSSNRLMDVETEATMNIQNLTEIDKRVLDARTQLQLVDYMRESISGNDDLQLLPTNIGLEDRSIELSLAEYNKLVLERQDLLRTATPENPVVQRLTQNIQDVNRNLLTSLDNYRSTLQMSLNNVQQRRNEIQGRLSTAPRQELGFRDISRQQQTIEAIYLFLLQKREENE